MKEFSLWNVAKRWWPAVALAALAVTVAFGAFLQAGGGSRRPVAALATLTPGLASPVTTTSMPVAQALTVTPLAISTHRPLPPTPHAYPTWRVTEGYTTIAKWPSIVFPSTLVNYMNDWRRMSIDPKYELRIYARGEGPDLPGGDPEQGVLVLVTSTWLSPLYLLDGPDVYRTPGKRGPVQIVWADYARLLVVSADDTPFMFDVSTRRWLWPPNAKQPVGQEDQAYRARMKALLAPFVPALPPGYGWPTPDPTDPPRPPQVLSPEDIGFPMGAGRIIRACENPTAGQPFLRWNCWYEELIDGTSVNLGAGYRRQGYGSDSEPGLIVVYGCPGQFMNGAYDRWYDVAGFYETPQDHGVVKVVGAEGERVRIASLDGTQFVFDLAACRWVVPPVPTERAPLPTFTPVTPTPTEQPWYSRMLPGDDLEYVLKMERLASSVLTAVAMTPVPTVPTTSTPIPPTATPRYAGAGIIVDGPFPPAPSEKFRYRNYWYEVRAGQPITVYAGVEGSKGDRLQGIIQVVDSRRSSQAAQYYRTPTKSGYVQIVGADGEKLRLKTWNGTEFVFDVPNRRWLTP
jgi:hypothetical protein